MHRAFLQLLNSAPWERARAENVFAQAAAHNQRLAEQVKTSPGSGYDAELRRLNYIPPGPTPYWLRFSSSQDPDAQLWQVAETTPIWQSAETEGITGLTPVPARPGQGLYAEIQFVRSKRLAFLTLAGYAERLATRDLPDDLETLRASEAAKVILDPLERQVTENSGSVYEPKSQIRTSDFYIDPITRNRFDFDLRSEHARLRPQPEYQLSQEATP
jgi:hypothetical protein